MHKPYLHPRGDMLQLEREVESVNWVNTIQQIVSIKKTKSTALTNVIRKGGAFGKSSIQAA